MKLKIKLQGWRLGRRRSRQLQFTGLVLFTAGLVLIMGTQAHQLLGMSQISQPQQSSVSDRLPKPAQKTRFQIRSEIPAVNRSTVPSPILEKAVPRKTTKPQVVTSVIPKSVQPLQKATFMPVRATQNMFGHLPYAEALPENLVTAGRFVRENYEREELLETEAAQAFGAMLTAAKQQGVELMVISGFRNVADQQVLFERQIQRQGNSSAAARLSAPPGYSEHHTGYAIDIADVRKSETDLKVTFQETEAYQWLVQNAHLYGFEQSFPEHNVQGVSFEPWHWRFIGSPQAVKIFTAARSLGPEI